MILSGEFERSDNASNLKFYFGLCNMCRVYLGILTSKRRMKFPPSIFRIFFLL